MTRVFLAVALLSLGGVARADGQGATCAHWARQIAAGDKEACSDLCPQAAQFDHYDYRHGLSDAFRSSRGLDAFLAYLERSSIMGAGGEAHACAVSALLERWGDDAFADALLRQPTRVREQAVGLIDYAGLAHFKARYPRTYRLAAHA